MQTDESTIPGRSEFLAHYALGKRIEEAMAQAIRHGTGATVEVTLAAFRRYTVSGDPAQVEMARPIMELAGLRLAESIYDEELAEAFDYWQEV